MKTNPSKYWDRAWSLIDGCTPCSPGCDHCWSMAMGKRFHKWPDRATIRPDRLDIPLKTRNPTIFAVWNDLFHPAVPDNFRNKTFSIIEVCPEHTFLVLSKRTTMNDYIKRVDMFWNLPNLWLGVTVCNQQEADDKIPFLLQTSAAHRWISIEPMLGPIKFNWLYYGRKAKSETPIFVDAVILGGETGPGARPMQIEWAWSVYEQCKVAGVPFFLKSLGQGKGRELDGREHNDLPWRVR